MMKNLQRANSFRRIRRTGLALVATLWILAVLTMIVWGFTAMAQGERHAAANYVDSARAGAAARAGIQRALLEVEGMNPEYVSLDQPWTELDSETDGLEFANARYIVRGIDESAKLNLNAEVDTVASATLKNLIGEQLADTILDWRDADHTARLFGAERDYYGALASPYRPRNGPLELLDELLMVKGITPQMFCGPRSFSNGDGAAADRQLGLPLLTSTMGKPSLRSSLPLRDLLTIYSQVDNTDAQGLARLDLNSATREGFQRNLGDTLSAADIDAILRYRDGNNREWKTRIHFDVRSVDVIDKIRLREHWLIDPREAPAPPSRESPALNSSASGKRPPVLRRQQSGYQAEIETIASSHDMVVATTVEAGERLLKLQDFDVAAGYLFISSHHFSSPGELLDVPLSRDKVRAIADRVAVDNSRTPTDCINLNTAPVQLLQAIPGITERIATDIVAYRKGASGPFRSVGDLLALPSVTNDAFKRIIDWVTVRSNVFRFVSEGTAPVAKVRKRIEVVAVLVTEQPAREVPSSTSRLATSNRPVSTANSVREVIPAKRKAYVVYRRDM